MIVAHVIVRAVGSVGHGRRPVVRCHDIGLSVEHVGGGVGHVVGRPQIARFLSGGCGGCHCGRRGQGRDGEYIPHLCCLYGIAGVGSGKVGESLGDAGHGLAYVVVGCRVAQADIPLHAECASVDGGHMALLEQIHRQVGRRGYLSTLGCGLADICAHLGEEVEGTLRTVDLEARNCRRQLHHQVASPYMRPRLPSGLSTRR